MKLIDVSHHNGDIDWTRVKKDSKNNIEGVIIRAGFGKSASQKDKQFENNYSGAEQQGLHIGAYWYSYALNTEDAELEAKAFLECIQNKKFDLPVFFDIEDKTQVPLGKKVCTDITEKFMSVIEKAGYFAGVYSFDSFFKTNLTDDIRKKYAIWTARVENVQPQCAPEWGIHQYSWKGRVDGIKNDTDLNECRRNYPDIIKAAGLNGYGNK